MRTRRQKLKIWIPVCSGLLIACILAAIGENDEAPVLTLLGFISSILLLFCGAYNAAAQSSRSLPAGCFLLSVSLIGMTRTMLFWFAGEYADSPGVGGLIVLISLGFAVVGARFLMRRK